MNLSYNELVKEIAKILPHATFDQDNDGQLIIYTDLMQTYSDDDDPLEDFIINEDCHTSNDEV